MLIEYREKKINEGLELILKLEKNNMFEEILAIIKECIKFISQL